MAVEKLPLSMIEGAFLAADQAARYDAMLLAFRNQMLSGRVFDGMVQGMSDAFEDESGIAGDIENVPVALSAGTLAGNMIGGAGLAAAFNGVTGTSGSVVASAANGTGIGYVGKIWDSPKIIAQVNATSPQEYGFQGSGNSTYHTVYFQGSNDTTDGIDGTWTTLASANYAFPAPTVAHFSATDLPKTTYAAHRVCVASTNSATAVYVAEISMTETFPGESQNAVYDSEDHFYSSLPYTKPPEMSLVSVTHTAIFPAAFAQIAIWEEDISPVTVNTDIQAYASSDNGTTWDEVALSELANLNGGRLLGGTVSLTGGGQEMRWKIATHNGKAMKIHATGMLWG